MLPKAHLTSHSRMSGSRWVTYTITVIRIIKTFLVQFFCVFLPPLLNLFCLCYVLAVSVLYCAHPAWKFPLMSPIFLKWSLVFPILLFSSISLQFSFKKAFSFLALLWNSAFRWEYLSLSPLPFTSLFLSAICKASSDNPFLAFLCHCTTSCTTLWTSTIVLQAFYQI